MALDCGSWARWLHSPAGRGDLAALVGAGYDYGAVDDMREGPSGERAVFWSPRNGVLPVGTGSRVLLIDSGEVRDITGTVEEHYYLDR